MIRGGAVYIMTNKRNGTLYTGVTSDLKKRVWQHRNSVFPIVLQQNINATYWFIIKATQE